MDTANKIPYKATWIGEDHLDNEGELLATRDDTLEIHGKHEDGDYVVCGDRSTSFFWGKPENLILIYTEES